VLQTASRPADKKAKFPVAVQCCAIRTSTCQEPVGSRNFSLAASLRHSREHRQTAYQARCNIRLGTALLIETGDSSPVSIFVYYPSSRLLRATSHTEDFHHAPSWRAEARLYAGFRGRGRPISRWNLSSGACQAAEAYEESLRQVQYIEDSM
jgi:hypothetical protein